VVVAASAGAIHRSRSVRWRSWLNSVPSDGTRWRTANSATAATSRDADDDGRPVEAGQARPDEEETRDEGR